MDRVIESRPPAPSFSRRDLGRSWNASVELSPACRQVTCWWLRNLCHAHLPLPVPAAHRQPRVLRCQRHEAGAVISVEGPEAAASSVVRALQRTAPLGMSSSSEPAAGSNS